MDHKAFLEKQELFLKFVEITSDITKREKLQTFRNQLLLHLNSEKSKCGRVLNQQIGEFVPVFGETEESNGKESYLRGSTKYRAPYTAAEAARNIYKDNKMNEQSKLQIVVSVIKNKFANRKS